MTVGDIKVNIVMRPLWQRVLRFPLVCARHYRVLRRYNGRVVSIYGAWLMAGVTVRWPK